MILDKNINTSRHVFFERLKLISCNVTNLKKIKQKRNQHSFNFMHQTKSKKSILKENKITKYDALVVLNHSKIRKTKTYSRFLNAMCRKLYLK